MKYPRWFWYSIAAMLFVFACAMVWARNDTQRIIGECARLGGEMLDYQGCIKKPIIRIPIS